MALGFPIKAAGVFLSLLFLSISVKSQNSAKWLHKGWQYINADLDSSQFFFRKVLRSSSSSQKQVGMASGRLGQTFYISNQYDSAYKYLRNALEIGQQLGSDSILNPTRLAMIDVLKKRGNLPDAEQMCRMVLSGQAPDNYKAGAFSLLGEIFRWQEINDSAVFYFQKAKELELQLGNEYHAALCQLLLVDTYQALNKCKEANEELELVKTGLFLGVDAEATTKYYACKATVSQCLHEFDSARVFLFKSLQLARKHVNVEQQIGALNNLGHLFNELGMYDSSRYYFLNAYSVAKENHAQQYLEKLSRNLASTVGNDNVIKAEKIKKQTAEKRLLAVGLFIILLAFSFIVFTLNQKIKHRKRLAEKDAELHQRELEKILKEKEVETLNALMEGQEKERKRLGEELHDKLGGMLSTIKYQFSALIDKVDGLAADSGNEIKRLNQLIDVSAGEVRRLSHQMTTSILSKFGLDAALRELVHMASVNGKLKVNYVKTGDLPDLSPEIELNFYRITQEALSNIMKYANASVVSISLTIHDDEISLVIDDNGKGFNVSEAEKGLGIGLENMKKRAHKCGAHLSIDSSINRGTTIIAALPR